jgi:flagellar motor switch protein FliN/FliY
MSDDAIFRLGRSTAKAISGVLETLAPGQVVPGEVTVVGNPFDTVPAPGVAISVSYVDAVTGGHVFVMTLEGARRLAAAVGGTEPQDTDAPELSQTELSTLADAIGQMMASAAVATSSVIGTDVEVGEPATRTFTAASDARDAYPKTPHAVRAAFTVCGEPCSLVQLIPSAFVVRMTRALDELDAEVAPASPSFDGFHVPAGPSLAGIPVRVWAELGRAQMPSAQVVGLPAGAVVELDRAADEPIDLYVNGRRFATGRLVVVDGADWAVRIDDVLHAGDGLADA